MGDEQNVAYIIGMAAGALIEAMGMMSENQQRIAAGQALAYKDIDFNALMEERGLHHNALIGQLTGR